MIRIKAGEAVKKYGLEQLMGVKAAMLDTVFLEEEGESYEAPVIVFGEIGEPLDDGVALSIKDDVSGESFFAFKWEFIILDDRCLHSGAWLG